MDILKAQNFALALTQLCRDHQVMLWTEYETAPILASDTADDRFHYRIAIPEVGPAVIVQRVLV